VSQQVSVFRRFFADQPPDETADGLPRFVVVNWLIDSITGGSATIVNHVFRRVGGPSCDPAVDAAMRRFLAGTEEVRNSMFKFSFRMVDGPGVVKRAIFMMGGERPVLIGNNKLTTWYHRGPNYLEIDMDVSSSRAASLISGTILGNVGRLVMDLAWILEAARKEELPERVLVSLRWNWNVAQDVMLRVDEKGEIAGKVYGADPLPAAASRQSFLRSRSRSRSGGVTQQPPPTSPASASASASSSAPATATAAVKS